jgi:predicted AAA+ superfamily ATPase
MSMHEILDENEPQIVDRYVMSKSKYTINLYPLTTDLIKNYVYNLYNKKKESAKIIVIRLYGMSSFHNAFVQSPVVNYNPENELYHFDDDYLFSTIIFNNETYEITFKSFIMREYGINKTFQVNNLWISGITTKADKAKELANTIVDESIKFSNLSRKILSYNPLLLKSADLLTNIKVVNTPNVILDELYIPDHQREQIKRFIFTVNNYEEKKLSLRYCFSGKPGTGKTQLINAIINETRGAITVVITTGDQLPVTEMFNFCEYFKPCLLIIDDLDFIAAERNDNTSKQGLGSFLQALDGFLPNNVFLLAATNDKNLVDKAASRPGRFDLILDLGNITQDNYLSLVKRETQNPDIISFFDSTTLDELKTRNITGAFLVSLIKQLESAMMMKGSLKVNDFKEYLELTHKGFYSYNSETFNKPVGFN